MSLAFLVSAVDIGRNPSLFFFFFLPSLSLCGHCIVEMREHEACKAKMFLRFSPLMM